ncbi:hypothetical protein GCM10010515_02450 [Streptomyces fructofermentans]|uniref:Uncharacterized protein n=1 Tax=Streptomyces fructofermentans TaxID=152141 RepID=A0A918JZK4_9ACTN|nr:hypothetical protein GCM10010515_02450 [Streptomyces fructofermentans]
MPSTVCRSGIEYIGWERPLSACSAVGSRGLRPYGNMRTPRLSAPVMRRWFAFDRNAPAPGGIPQSARAARGQCDRVAGLPPLAS